MAITDKWIISGSETSLLAGTDLNGLTNNGLVLGNTFNNNQGGTGGGYTFCRLTCTFKFQSTPTSSTGLSFWFVRSDANGNYEDGSNSVTPARAADVVFGVGSNPDTNSHTVMRDVLLPPGNWKPLLKNDGTGQALTANNTDNTVSITPFTGQGV